MMKERIIQIMNAEGLFPSKFAEEIGIQRAAMSHIISERNKPSLDVITKILERFSYINPDWLLLGTGDMKRNMSKNPVRSEPDLFTNVSTPRPQEKKITDYQKEHSQEPVNRKPVSSNQPAPGHAAIKEAFTSMETPIKRITRIMIFYSDNTFETFQPEKQNSPFT
jgi:DNA-binding XRE family transcriptional regulator